MSKFKYDNIIDEDGIRLILLEPRRVQCAPIQCSLIHTTLSKHDDELIDQYTALSYVWGDTTNTRTVLVDGLHVDVAENLHTALSDLQDEQRPLYLWADALCINQDDIEEKSRQVAMMGRIYMTAHHTIIYLGPLTTASKVLLDVLSSWSYRDRKVDNHVAENGAADILQRPWFNRVWVVQELVLSRDPWIQCGTLRVRWDRLYDCLEPRFKSPKLVNSSKSFSQIHKVRMDYQGSLFSKTARPGLGQVVAARQGSGASDPRDMIYAFLGFASEALDQDLAVDYGKPCVDIYIDFARYAIKEYDNPKLLSFVSELPSDQRVKGLPSWVPDWSRPPHGLDKEFSSGRTVNWKHRQHGPCFVVIRDPPVLACAGRQLDVIRSVSDGLSVNCIHSDQRRQFQEELQQIKGTEGTPLKSRRSQKMFKDLCIDVYNTWRKNLENEILHPLDKKTFRDSRFSTMISRRHGSLDIRLREDGSLEASSLALLLTDMLNSQRFFQSSVDGKRIALTRSGSCFLVPASTCEGDTRVECAETCTWNLRPLNLQEDPVAGDSRIHHLLKAGGLAIEEHGRFLALIGKRNFKHSKFIGEGWMDWSRPRRRALSPPEEVFVLH